MNITSENMQDRFNETVEKTLKERPGTDIQKAVEIAYDELKPKYQSDFIFHYKYMAEFSAELKKDPVKKRIARTAKRPRGKEDYDEKKLQHTHIHTAVLLSFSLLMETYPYHRKKLSHLRVAAASG